MLAPPRQPTGPGLFMMDPNGGQTGIAGTWQSPSGGLGFRLGLTETPANELTIFGGLSTSALLAPASANFPLDVSLVAGAGAGVGNWTLVSVPVGLSLGRTIYGNGVSFTPYLTPRFIVDGRFGNTPYADHMDTALAVDLGLDLRFRPGWAIRFGGTFGDRNAVALGLVF
ncbi:MAG TPA: hypothetical protein VJ957_04405 [Longimicrobiales bacterium]|nr:hypothetical protein [Longimicrobiales bacterium]